MTVSRNDIRVEMAKHFEKRRDIIPVQEKLTYLYALNTGIALGIKAFSLDIRTGTDIAPELIDELVLVLNELMGVSVI